MVTYQGFWADGTKGDPNNLNAGLLQQDVLASRPAAGKAGVFFFATDTFDLYRDNGVTWDLVGKVISTGAQTFAGVKTFGDIPVLPASDPTTDNQAARKAYVDKFGEDNRTEAKATAGSTSSESVTWTTAFATTPVVVTSAESAAGAAIISYVTARSTTGATVESRDDADIGVAKVKTVIANEAT